MGALGVKEISVPNRIIIVLLKALGWNTAQISLLINIYPRLITRIFSRAKDRGFNPNQQPIDILLEYIEDAPRSGRPLKKTPEL